MAKSLEFGRSVLVMDADDAKLEAALKADEQLVNRSVNKMQGNLNKLEVSMGTTGDTGRVAATGVTALSAAAAATGSTSLAAGAAVANMGIALRVMGNEALGAAAQLKALGAAGVAFIATPIGAAIAAIAVATGALALVISKTSREMDKLLKTMEEVAARDIALLEQRIKFREQLAGVTDKIAVAEGEMSKERARFRELIRSSPDLRHAQIVELVAAEQELAQLGRQTEFQKAREARVVKAIAQTEREQLQNDKERLRLAEERVRAAEAEARALSGRAGPQTPAEARSLISDELELEAARQRGRYELERQLDRARPGGQRAGAIEELLRRFGFGAAPAAPTTRFGPGALELSAFAATGRGGVIGAGADPIQTERIAKERKRTTDVETIKNLIERLVPALEALRIGAG